MIPDPVLHKYTELLAQQPVNSTELALLISLDAQLLARWCRLLKCKAAPGPLLDAISALDAGSLPGLGLAIAIDVMPDADAPRPSLDEWGGRLANSVLGELLAGPMARIDSGEVRLQCLLGLADLSVDGDPLAEEMLEFRGESTEFLQDAHPLVQIFSIVESYHAGEDAAAIAAAETLLNVGGSEFSELLAAAAERTDALMSETSLVDERYGDWFGTLWQQLQISTFNNVLARSSDTAGLVEAHELATRGLFSREPLVLALTGEPASVEFGYGDPALGSVLRLLNCNELQMLRIDVSSANSRIAECVRNREALEINDRAATLVAERQLLRRLGERAAKVYPLESAGEVVGACVFPLPAAASDESQQQELSRRAYAQALGNWVALRAAGDDGEDGDRQLADYASRVERRMREIVHEANNPLSVVRNYLHILDMKLENNPEAREQVELISEEVRRASEVIRQAVDVPRDIDAKPAVDTRVFDLNELVGMVCELQGQAARVAGIDVVAELSPGEVRVGSDRDRLTQVLTNLVKNAVEALSSGDRVIVSTATGVFRAGREGVEVKVSDTGPGLPPEVLRTLFEPKTSSKGGQHEGLGLHLVKRLVDELLGEIDVRSAPGRGAEFAVFLPLVVTPAAD